ncbi:MAG: NHL repeat-containing protein [Phycisphaerae bacterium]|nr:NHL repeat-containing protein [Phycisphaerae bacterium]
MKLTGGNGRVCTAHQSHYGVQCTLCAAAVRLAPAPHSKARTSFFFLLSFAFCVALGAQGRAESEPAFNGIRIRTKSVIAGPRDEPFSMPSDAAVGRGGSLYVLDGVHHRVVVYDPAGQFLFKFGSRGSGTGQLLFPLGITTAPDGKVYVADSGNHRFQIFTANGETLGAVPLPSTASGAPPDPTDVSVDATRSKLYVTDNDNHKLHVYNLLTNSFEQPWGSPGQGRRQFRFPFLTDISNQGYVLVVEPINTRVQVLNPDGKFVNFIGAWGVKPGQLFRPKGVVTFEDRVFITDSYLGRVQVFDMRGGFLGVLSDFSGAPVQLAAPTGITVDAKRRRLYVVELKANRVCRMDLE